LTGIPLSNGRNLANLGMWDPKAVRDDRDAVTDPKKGQYCFAVLQSSLPSSYFSKRRGSKLRWAEGWSWSVAHDIIVANFPQGIPTLPCGIHNRFNMRNIHSGRLPLGSQSPARKSYNSVHRVQMLTVVRASLPLILAQ